MSYGGTLDNSDDTAGNASYVRQELSHIRWVQVKVWGRSGAESYVKAFLISWVAVNADPD
jgi:hypothetical protein